MKILLQVILLSVLSPIALPAYSSEHSGSQGFPYKTGDPSTWPPEQDAVSIAPENHTVLLENESVRVLAVKVAPLEREKVHHHRWPSVLYIMEAGDFIDRDANGNVIFDSRELDTPLSYPLTMWKDPEAPHSVENLSSTTTIRLIRVEMKSQ